MNTSTLSVPLLACVLMVSACQGDDPQTQPFEPLFQGLATGQYNTATGCVTLGALSARLDTADFDQRLRIYTSPACKESELALTRTLTIESQLAGVWQGYLVIDEGTGPDERELLLIPVEASQPAYSFSYTQAPVFTDTGLSFLMPLDVVEPACDAQQAQLDEWRRQGLGVGLAKEKVFDPKTGQTRDTGETRCFPLQ